MRLALTALTVSSRSAGRVFSLWACPPSPYRPRGRPRWATGAAFALPTYRAAASAADVAIFDATWGCFLTIGSTRYMGTALSFVHGVVFRRNSVPRSNPLSRLPLPAFVLCMHKNLIIPRGRASFAGGPDPIGLGLC